jgi:hypothetical protein
VRNFAWLSLLLAAVGGCAGRYSIKEALLSEYMGDCPGAKAVNTGEKDCDGLPIYALWCDGRAVHSEAIWCHKGNCFARQMAGRCWKGRPVNDRRPASERSSQVVCCPEGARP